MKNSNFSESEWTGIKQAANLLRTGALVAIPTETVYGLAANAFNEQAVQLIYQTKGRPNNNPLIVHIKNIDELKNIAQNIPEMAWRLAVHFWPGPLTLILNKKPCISNIVSANYETVGIRVPNHPMTLELLHQLDFPLVAPSANRSNHISPTRPEHVVQSLGSKQPFILDGGFCAQGLESTIIGFRDSTVVILRQGAIPQEDIENIVGDKVLDLSEVTEQNQSPGSSLKHYAPKTPLILLEKIEMEIEHNGKRVGYIVLKKTFSVEESNELIALSENGNLREAAANLYDALHKLDNLNLDLLYVEKMPELGLGKAINDRLNRAAAK